jgi:hypothetical protein
MPEPTYYPPSFDVSVVNLPTTWSTFDVGTFDIRYGCEHPMEFTSSGGGGEG